MSLLSQIKVGTDHKPPRLLVYGSAGIGKTSLAASAPGSILIDVEGGADEIGMARFPQARTYDDVIGQISALVKEPHDFRTLCIDSLDWLQKLVWAKTAERLKVPSIQDIPYGRGFAEAEVEWQLILRGVEAVRTRRNMAVILIAHSEVKRYDDPSCDGYDRHQIALHKTASALVQEWADAVLFYGWHVVVKQSDAGFNRKISKGRGNGARLLHTEERPSALAKNRYGMPERIEMPDSPDAAWDALAQCLPFFSPQQISEPSAQTPALAEA